VNNFPQGEGPIAPDSYHDGREGGKVRKEIKSYDIKNFKAHPFWISDCPYPFNPLVDLPQNLVRIESRQAADGILFRTTYIYGCMDRTGKAGKS